MPELPEVETLVRTLRDGLPTLIGRVVKQADIHWSGVLSGCSDDICKAGLEGSKFVSISRHGKYLVFEMRPQDPDAEQIFLIVHLRMTGRLYLLPETTACGRHTRLTLQLDGGLVLRFDDPRKFGRIRLVKNTAEVLSGLGQDALSVGFDYFRSTLSKRNRQIKPLLLDQSFIAGVGNIYADEAFFRARIHPLTSSDSLGKEDIMRLHHAIIAVLNEAVAAKGANIDGVFEEGGFIVAVYGRTAAACQVCGGQIQKIKVGQRGTHFCPVCQPLSDRPTRNITG